MDQATAAQQDAEQSRTLLLPTALSSTGASMPAQSKSQKAASSTPLMTASTTTSRIRLIVRILSFLLTGAIVIVLAHALSIYFSSRDKTMYDARLQIDIRVWPNNMKTRPTLLLLGAASAATLLSGTLCVGSFSKVVRRLTPTSNILTMAVSAVALALWIAVAILYKADDLNPAEHWDMLSFTCGRRHDAALDAAIGNLGSLCLQMRYAWWVTIAVGLLELVALGTVVWAWWSGRWSRGDKGAYRMLDTK
ncbi:hypothetical protein LTR84_005966 [Exophiala bonariae]|uniref:MARVEL domain-containing protein n=1 Tax=Exophiala bonariae TaxID=1690606 RepID=A0AAV9N6I6_9EURO|nr:hypothetical protein LTR84_005966 [Exophiala bonariae]